jgi:hypothetical protein
LNRVPAEVPFLWPPQPGRRQLVLVDAAGNPLDRIRFEVRGLRAGKPLRDRRSVAAAMGQP